MGLVVSSPKGVLLKSPLLPYSLAPSPSAEGKEVYMGDTPTPPASRCHRDCTFLTFGTKSTKG